MPQGELQLCIWYAAQSSKGKKTPVFNISLFKTGFIKCLYTK